MSIIDSNRFFLNEHYGTLAWLVLDIDVDFSCIDFFKYFGYFKAVIAWTCSDVLTIHDRINAFQKNRIPGTDVRNASMSQSIAG